MSMSEFEKFINEHEWGEDELSQPSGLVYDFPADFSREDVAFAQELGGLFAIDEEEVPPYFVQTLLDADSPRYQVVEHRFEQKTSARVFRRLKLRRRLFGKRAPIVQSLTSLTSVLPKRKPFVALVAAMLLFMLMTMVATSSSFASGLNILMAGKHGGVIQSLGYPIGLLSRAAPKAKQHPQVAMAGPKRISLLDAQQQLQFPISLPTSLPAGYTLDTIYLHQNTNYTWADGPILELNYQSGHASVLRRASQITICEFKPMGTVLQVVQLGAAHLIQFDAHGQASAIYVDGQWIRINRYSHAWSYGTRSELIYEQNGVLFWIVGDQRDGISRGSLQTIAASLTPFNVQQTMHTMRHLADVSVPGDDSSWLFANDIVYIDSPDGPLWTTIGADNSEPSHLSITLKKGKLS